MSKNSTFRWRRAAVKNFGSHFLLYFSDRHSRSMNTLSIQRPRPSMEIATPASASAPVKATEVNCEPWSVLKISGLPNRARASSSADRQNETSIVFDSRHASTARDTQVDDRHEIEKAPPDRNVGDVGRPYGVRALDSPHCAGDRDRSGGQVQV